MSTTFEVYPVTPAPTFRALVDLGTERLHAILRERGLDPSARLRFSLKERDDWDVTVDPESALRWGDGRYAWFWVDGVPGGTDAYYCDVDALTRECWEHELQNREQSRRLEDLIATSLDNGFYWYFRRSAGQPAVVNLAYGVLAAALAELTEGILFSCDSAWDYERFPCRAQEFYTFYFHPEHALSEDFRAWARMCWASMPDELEGA